MTGTGDLVPPLDVGVGQRGRWTVVRLAGELDYATCDALAPVLDEVTGAAPRPCVAVDTSGLRFCDSSGLRCLVIAARRVRAGGGELVVVDAGPLRLRDKAWMRGLREVLGIVTELPA